MEKFFVSEEKKFYRISSWQQQCLGGEVAKDRGKKRGSCDERNLDFLRRKKCI